MKKKILSIVLFIVLLQPIFAQVIISNCSPDNYLICGWLQYPVTIDGQISSPDEWSDTDYVDMEWGLEIPPEPPYVNARVWAKNDEIWLYLLYRVEWPSVDEDDNDGAQVSYFWGEYVPPWDYADLGFVSYGGGSWDAYGWDDTSWHSDTGAGGEINVEGAATHDGTYYWFELRKELSSGDGYDWSFEPGEAYGFNPEVGGNILVGLWDSSIHSEYHEGVQIYISKEGPIENSIERGLNWLVTCQWQGDDVYPFDGGWGHPEEWDRTAMTGFALIKLQDRAYELGYDSPFDEEYEYSDEVVSGWEFVFGCARKQTIGAQDHTGGASGTVDDPDENGNGYGIFFEDIYSYHPTYSTGIVLMALEASRTPGRSSGLDFDGNGIPKSFFDVAQDAADWLAFAQGDSGNDEGGWAYHDLDNQTWEAGTDNSNSGYAMLGLAAAEGFGCTVPSWVGTELNVWITTIQDPVNGDPDDGGSYYNPDWLPWDPWVNELKTGNLIFEMTYYGDDETVLRFQDALDYIVRHWYDPNQDPGWRGSWGTDDDSDGLVDEDTIDWVDNDGDGDVDEDPPIAHYQAMFCLMKGFEYSGIDLIDLDGVGDPEHDWYAEFAQCIMDGQYPNGRWEHGLWGNDILNTCWALITLEKITPPPPTVTVSVDIKPGSWPNPINVNSQGLFTVAICGTETFDVTTIDPETVKLSYGENEVSPLRWAYDDVATPYTGGPCSGHDLEGDGFLDLVLKYDNQEVVLTFGLYNVGEIVPLTIKGQLHEEYDGTLITGRDCVLIRKLEFIDIGITSGGDDDYPSVYAIAKIAEKDINEYCEDEDLGFRFEFNIKNNKANPDRVYENMEEFNEEDINLIVGHPRSSQCGFVLDYANENNMIMLSPSSTSHLLAIPDDNLYRLTPPDPLTGKVIGELLNHHEIQAITIVYQDFPYGHGIKNRLVETCETYEIEVLSSYAYPWMDPWVFSTYLDSINSDLLDAVGDGYIYEQLAVIAIGYNGIFELLDQASNDVTYPELDNVVWYGSDYMAKNQELLVLDPFITEIMLYSPLGALNSDHPGLISVSDRFWDMTGQELGFYDATTYDCCWVFAESVLESQVDNAQPVKMAMEQLVVNYDGISGTSTFDENGDRIGADYDIWYYVIDGGVPTIMHYGYYDFETNTITED